MAEVLVVEALAVEAQVQLAEEAQVQLTQVVEAVALKEVLHQELLVVLVELY